MAVQLKPPSERGVQRALEALFREARALERRRRHRRATVALLGCVTLGAAAWFAVWVSRSSVAANGSARSSPAGAPAQVSPRDPFSLAMGPDGTLYVADPGRREVLRRSASGRFEAVPGTAVAGRPGVDDPRGGLVVAPDGSLYFTQEGIGVYHASTGTVSTPPSLVREVAPDGRVTTVIGAHPDCRGAGATARAIPAQDALIDGAVLAFGRAGNLYLMAIACPGVQNLGPLLELTRGGMLVDGSSSSFLDDPRNDCWGSGFAFSGSGALYVACDSGGGHGKEVVAVEPNGQVKAFPGVYPYDDASGLTTAPDGTVFAIARERVVRFTPHGAHTVINLGSATRHAFLGRFRGIAGSMEPNGIAVDRHGNLYLASTSGFGNGTFTGIVEVHTSGRVQVLWSRPSGSG